MTSLATKGGLRETAASIHLVVLGAGFGSRFGRFGKLDASLSGMPLAHHCLGVLSSFHWMSRTLVCQGSPSWAPAFVEAGFGIARNEKPKRGMSSSLRAGIEALPVGSSAMICLADMPFVEGSHISRLLNAVSSEGDRIVGSRAGTYRGPPAIFPVSDLKRLPPEGERGARSLLMNARFIDCEPFQLLDIDTQSDMDIARRLRP